MIGCYEIAKELGLPGGCCESCHEDEAEGYHDLQEFDLPDGRIARICCRTYAELEDHFNLL